MIMMGKVEWVSIGNDNQESLVLKKPMMSNEYEDSNHASNLAIVIFLLMSLQQQEASAYKYLQDHSVAHKFLPLDLVSYLSYFGCSCFSFIDSKTTTLSAIKCIKYYLI